MGRRKEAQLSNDADQWRRSLLIGIKDKEAVMLYDSGMATLAGRGQADYMAAMQLRDAALWTQDIASLSKQIHAAVRAAQETDGAAVRSLIRTRTLAERARREILDGLLLTPQRPRGRPRKEDAPEDTGEAGDAWEDFDKADGSDSL